MRPCSSFFVSSRGSGGKVFFGTFFFRGEVKNKTSQRRQKKELTKARRCLLIADIPLSAVSRRTTLDMQITSPPRGNCYMSQRARMMHTNAHARTLAEFGFALFPVCIFHVKPPMETFFSWHRADPMAIAPLKWVTQPNDSTELWATQLNDGRSNLRYNNQLNDGGSRRAGRRRFLRW
jgi:hypothetical protein